MEGRAQQRRSSVDRALLSPRAEAAHAQLVWSFFENMVLVYLLCVL